MNLQDIFMTWGGASSIDVSEVYMMKLKNNKKELDPKGFNDKEKKNSVEAHTAE